MNYEGRAYLAAIETRPSLVSNHDIPDGHSLKAVLRRAIGRDRAGYLVVDKFGEAEDIVEEESD